MKNKYLKQNQTVFDASDKTKLDDSSLTISCKGLSRVEMAELPIILKRAGLEIVFKSVKRARHAIKE